ncbi:MAG: hypothetical protein HC875_41575 [Anaerolineales bacterium]|nr:hypothetical protein [Anaerolineales bacterium]
MSKTSGIHAVSKYLGLALISASVLALQVIFTRIFSIMIWHHFTYLVVGVALLGGALPVPIWQYSNGVRPKF